MADHKRQHYVPRCYMRPFSVDGAGAAINLFNISRSRAVPNASVKGQCAKNYLYGENLILEKLLQRGEEKYIRSYENVCKGHISENVLATLRGFALLQYLRTDMAVKRMRLAHEGMHNAIFEGRRIGAPEMDLSDRALMLSSMRMFAEVQDTVEDLKVCIIRNETSFDFVTSDDPSVFTNRFHFQRLRENTFGLGSAGALFFLPISPRFLVICYDGDVYTVPGKQGSSVAIQRVSDVLALNELQYLKAPENIYFYRWNDRERIESEFQTILPQRPASWCRFRVFVPDTITGQWTRYRLATEEERRSTKEATIQMSNVFKSPATWVSSLRYRDRPRSYYNGSAAGHVRRSTWVRRQVNAHMRDIHGPRSVTIEHPV